LFLEIFVGFIQAFIFGMLTLVFVSMSTAEHGHEEATAHA
jgi:F0F1-type ATP synthase membrane subunit a